VAGPPTSLPSLHPLGKEGKKGGEGWMHERGVGGHGT